MLDPMLFDRAVVKEYGAGARAHGFKVLKNTLFLTCTQEIAKLALDADPRSPSIRNIVEALESTPLLHKLREQYAVWHVDPPAGETDPHVLAALAAIDKCEEAQRRNEFDARVAQLRTDWNVLSVSPPLRAFKIIRNKVSAHTDVHLVNGRYELVDIGNLGIRWKDLRVSIEALQQLVELVGHIVRCSSFAWDSLDHQLTKATSGFWGVPNKML